MGTVAIIPRPLAPANCPVVQILQLYNEIHLGYHLSDICSNATVMDLL